MRRFMLLIIALAIFLPTLAQAYDILVLQSRPDGAYQEVLNGFRSIHPNSQRLIVMSDYAEVDVIRLVREDHPRLVLAIGDAALTAARKVRTIPVLAVMSLGLSNATAQANLTGITMYADPGHYCNLLQTMKLRRVGIIYNPAKTGWYLKQIRTAAAQHGIELIVREVREARDTISQLSSLNKKTDAIWMIPDTTAVTRETAEAYMHFGQEQNIPVISFAASYLKLGAAAIVDIDRTALGTQAAAMATRILDDYTTELSVSPPTATTNRYNLEILKKLNVSTDNLNKTSAR